MHYKKIGVFVSKLGGLYGSNGPFPRGEWLDQEITQLGKLIIIIWTTTSAMWGMEGYYDDGQQWGAETTTRHNNPE